MESSLETINHSKHLRSYADLSNFCTPISTRRFLLIRETFFNFIFITQNLCDCKTRLITFQKKKKEREKKRKKNEVKSIFNINFESITKLSKLLENSM